MRIIRTIFLCLPINNSRFNFVTVMLLIFLFFPIQIRSQSIVGKIEKEGLKPLSMVVYEAASKLCVFNSTDDKLLIYSENDLSLIKEIQLTRFWTSGAKMIIDEQTGKLYVGVEGRVYIIELNNNYAVKEKTISNAGKFCGMEADFQKRQIYALSMTDIYILNIDTEEGQKLSFSSYSLRTALCVNPVTHEVFITNRHEDNIDILDGNTLSLSKINGITGWDIVTDYKRNKIYVSTWTWGGIWMLNRITGESKIITPVADYSDLFYSPETDRIYTNAEIDEKSLVINTVTDEGKIFPMGSFSGIGFRTKTKHLYYPNSTYIGVFDEENDFYEQIPVEGLYGFSGLIYSSITVNQTSGRVYCINDAESFPTIIVLQDEDHLTKPNLLIGNEYIAEIYVVDEDGMRAERRLLSQVGYNFAFVPGGSRFYTGGGSLKIYEGSGNYTLLKSLHHAGTAKCVVVSPDKQKVYFTNPNQNNIGVLNNNDFSLITNISVGKYPFGIGITSDGRKILVTNQNDNSVSIVDVLKQQTSSTINVGSLPWGVAINPSSTKAYVANSNSGTVSVIDLYSEKLLKNITVGNKPEWFAFSNDGKYVYVTNRSDKTISVIDAGLDIIAKTVQINYTPYSICSYPFNDKIYFGCYVGTIALDSKTYETKKINTNIPTVLGVADPSVKIAGRINNNQGIPLSGVVIKAFLDGTEKGSTTTNASGDFCIGKLAPGIYSVEVTFADQTKSTYNNLSIKSGQVKIINMGIGTDINNEIMTTVYKLEQNYPNPFNPNTAFKFGLPLESKVTLSIYNILGQQVARIVDGLLTAGYHFVNWDASNFSSGVYIYRIEALPTDGSKPFTQVRKMILMK